VNVIALLLAVLLCSKIKRQTFFRAAFFFPATLSLITIGLVFNELYYRAIPVLGKALEIDWLSKNILSSSSTAIWGILFVHVWKSVSIPMVLLIAGMQNISGDLYEAAEIDGANAIHRFFKITLPLLMPVLSVCIILVTKEGLTVYDYIMVMTSGGPAGSTQSIAFLIYENAFVNTRFSYAITQSVVIFALVCLVSFFQFKSSRRKGE
ncbi:MAG: sugar ABC transporter permease, partial [Clostridia bacterium]